MAEVFRKNQRLRILYLSLNNLDDQQMEELCEGLKYPECTIEMLQLSGEILSESSSRYVAEVFRKNQRLRVLCLDIQNIDDKTMEPLCDGLKHPKCTIETLELHGEIAKESTMRILTEVFRENQRLKNLCLALNNPDDRVMEVLSEGLKHPQCSIEMLELHGEIGKESTMSHLKAVFKENQRLKKLFLTLKNPDERAMEILCEGLKHPQCTLEILVLGGENAKESTMRPLTEVFRENQRLKNLCLALKNPDDRVMEVLSEGLKHPQCSIEMLQLHGEIGKESTMRHLTEVFTKNQRLKNLCLALKNPDERAMEILCEGLKHPQCTLEMLELGGENAKESTMRPLTEVFRENRRLTNLCLALKNPDDRVMEVLSEGLKHPQCSIEMLQLQGEIAKESNMSHLTEVFRENQRLKKLLLTLKNPDERAMEILCEGLKHPQCTLEILVLGGENAKESTMRPLTEVFRENRRLRNLCLSLKNPDERVMEVLVEGLKHPQCSIEKLELHGEIVKESTMSHLTEVFRDNQRLKKLFLTLNNPDERALEILCEGLKHPQCTLEMLVLGGEIAKESTMRPLTEVFRENQRLNNLCLALNNPDDRVMEVLSEGLKHPQCSIEMLELGGEIAKESTIRPLSEVFRENQRLKNLCLALNNPDDRVMEVLSEGLKHPQCSIEIIRLHGEIAKESTMRHLTEVFRENQRLKNLCLTLKNQDERAMEILCEGLKHPQCALEMLELGGENAKESTMRPLTEVFRENRRLRNLCLALKNPDDRVMEVLSEGLKHPQCSIEMLQLHGEIAKESTMRRLTEVFRENRRLKKLLLTLKNPDERAMEILCEGLKHPQCTLEMLLLGGENAKESTMRPLTEVFRENRRLRNLCLALKNPDDRVMEVLSEGLKHPQCSIQMLQLHGEIAKESTMMHLTEVFRENQRLKKLLLTLKNPDERAMEILCEGLKHPQCTLEMLVLGGENAKESTMRRLTEVFKENQRLKNLCLALKNPDDRVMEVLVEGLKHPRCSIEILEFSGESLSESCLRYLAEVFRGNQRLRQLELSLRNPDEKTMGPLYKGLKHPECNIETLQLNGKYIIQNGKWNETSMVQSPARI
uniref:Uncharacterized protein n=1 Tax=Naja naja TaxID=35670 RepID=A0A8C6VCF6_NAJNA